MKNLFTNQSGQDIIEYALLVSLIAFGAVVVLKNLGIEIAHAFELISTDLASSI